MDKVRMDAEQRTGRYKNLMSRQYDAMVKPRHFKIGDLVLKRVTLTTRCFMGLQNNSENSDRGNSF